MLNKNAAFFTRKKCPHLNYGVKTEVKILFAEIFAEMCLESGKSSVLIMTINGFLKRKKFLLCFLLHLGRGGLPQNCFCFFWGNTTIVCKSTSFYCSPWFRRFQSRFQNLIFHFLSNSNLKAKFREMHCKASFLEREIHLGKD